MLRLLPRKGLFYDNNGGCTQIMKIINKYNVGFL